MLSFLIINLQKYHSSSIFRNTLEYNYEKLMYEIDYQCVKMFAMKINFLDTVPSLTSKPES